jgi:hypothetical protein
MWKNMVEPEAPQMIIWFKRFACWTIEATVTNSEYVTLIAFPCHQWLDEHASWLRTYVHCLSSKNMVGPVAAANKNSDSGGNSNN